MTQTTNPKGEVIRAARWPDCFVLRKAIDYLKIQNKIYKGNI
jgi:hypothetical protein